MGGGPTFRSGPSFARVRYYNYLLYYKIILLLIPTELCHQVVYSSPVVFQLVIYLCSGVIRGYLDGMCTFHSKKLRGVSYTVYAIYAILC